VIYLPLKQKHIFYDYVTGTHRIRVHQAETVKGDLHNLMELSDQTSDIGSHHYLPPLDNWNNPVTWWIELE
jgi:hypothetical protein